MTRKVSRSLHFSGYPPFSHTSKSYAWGPVTFLEAGEWYLACKKAIQEMQPFFQWWHLKWSNNPPEKPVFGIILLTDISIDILLNRIYIKQPKRPLWNESYGLLLAWSSPKKIVVYFDDCSGLIPAHTSILFVYVVLNIVISNITEKYRGLLHRVLSNQCNCHGQQWHAFAIIKSELHQLLSMPTQE